MPNASVTQVTEAPSPNPSPRMTSADEHRPREPANPHDRVADWQAAEEELLGRVREVARRITERVQKVLDDTTDQPALPGDGTAEAPPVG